MDEFLSEAGGQDSSNAARRRWLSVLAKAGLDELEAAWAGLCARLDYEWLRRPEIGMVMVRARAGGTGEQFNLGPMTVTRCALKLAGGDATPSCVGLGYVQGPSHRPSALAAGFAAPLQAQWRSERRRVAARGVHT